MNMKNDICRNHSARNDKEIRVPPTNLSRRDLEDLYYSLLNDNNNLKCVVNSQTEKMKILSTKLLRVTASQRSCSKGNKCTLNIAVKEQNEIIKDLEEKNRRLTEKYRQLDMKLCSTKQFLKKNTVRCLRCTLNRRTSTNNLVTKRSDAALHLAASTQCESSDRVDSIRSNITNEEYSAQFEPLSERKDDDVGRKTETEDRNESLVELEQAIQIAVNKHSDEKERLEKSVDSLSKELLRFKSVCKGYEDKDAERKNDIKILERKLAEVEAVNCNLKTELSIEKKNNSELEMQARSSENTSQLVKIIEESLSSELQKKRPPIKNVRCPDCKKVYVYSFKEDSEIKTKVEEVTESQVTFSSVECSTPCKDDSGYVEDNKTVHERPMHQLNEELKLKIMKLEIELNIQKAHNAEQANTLLKLMTKENRGVDNPAVKILSYNKDMTCDSSLVNDNCVNDGRMAMSDVNEDIISKEEKSCGSEAVNRNIKNRGIENDINIVREKSERQRKKCIKTKPLKDDTARSVHKKQLDIKRNKELNNIIYDKAVTVIESKKSNESIFNTYNVYNAITSPDNTDYEISSLSNEASANKQASLSVGEDRGVFTYTSYVTNETSSSEGYLSEGELPLRKGKELSIGERKVDSKPIQGDGMKEKTTDSLEAVRKEIARCRYLLALSK